MSNISTKTGDQGESSLADGQRLPKNSLVFQAVGDLDELNTWLGIVVNRLGTADKLPADVSQHRQFLIKIQRALFQIGAELAQAKSDPISQKFLKQIEAESNRLQQAMAADWVQKFVLPGGTETAAWLDVARTVCRRAERSLVALNQKKKIRQLLLKIINRLSDYLYVLRGYLNQQAEYQEKVFSE